MLTKILIGLAVVVILFLITVAFQPAEFKVVRTTKINAPAVDVFGYVNDFHKWTAWSPWENLDPNLQRFYEGAPAGPGTIYRWVGNRKVGEGKMTLTESKPGEYVRIALDFLKPFAASNKVVISFKQEGNQTAVDWTMTGTKNFICKGMGMFMSMDKMCGGQFEQGLAQLKAVSETRPATVAGL
jgi:hypothetical protein